MKVRELIKMLEKIYDKELPVYVYFNDEIINISGIDDTISDRVDINAYDYR